MSTFPVANERTTQDKTSFIWSVADLLRGSYRPAQYGSVILPFTVLKRLDSVLAPTKKAVLARADKLKSDGRLKAAAWEPILSSAAKQVFYNTSKFDFDTLTDDPANIAQNLVRYVNGFSPRAKEIIESFGFIEQIAKLEKANLLYLIVQKFKELDVHPERVSNTEMGSIFEELIRRFSEQSNETAGEHYTPREVIRLMVNLLFIEDEESLMRPGIIRSIYDPCAGTGGMLSVADEHLRLMYPGARLELYGQELNPESYAICNSDMMLKGQNPDNVAFGDTLDDDRHQDKKFSFMLSNPPFGVEWKKEADKVRAEHTKLGMDGRFGPGLPRINDGSLLFLLHMMSKMKSGDEGSRIAIVLNGSPLFSGGAGSGESEIRRWIIENDYLEAVIALPEQMFYNTGIGTYIWVLCNHKDKQRQGKVQLIDARECYVPMRKSLGDKRRKLGEQSDGKDHIGQIVRQFGTMTIGETSKVFDNADFGYTRVTVERPLRLRCAITADGTRDFLEKFPDRKDDVAAIAKLLGNEPQMDWNVTWPRVEALLKKRGSKWRGAEQKQFRSLFTSSDPTAAPVVVPAGQAGEDGYEPDPDLRDFENIPLPDDIEAYFACEVLPHVPDAWMDRTKDKVGYEINFSRQFYKYVPPRPLTEIDADLKQAEAEIMGLLSEVTT
jgi:type I restriction enzyme M protein